MSHAKYDAAPGSGAPPPPATQAMYQQPVGAPYQPPPVGYGVAAPGAAPMAPVAGAPAAGMPYGGAVVAPVAGMGYQPPVGGMDMWQVLATLRGVIVKQQIELLEVLTGCETQNRYRVYAMNPDGTMGGELLYAHEKSGCLERQCCGSMREFDMFIDTIINGQNWIRLHRPFKCTCLCMNRPVLDVLDPAGNVLGGVMQPWACCDTNFLVRRQDGSVAFEIKGRCCQAGRFCRCPCAPCNRVVFEVFRPGSAAQVAEIAREWSGCVKESFTDADKFSCVFPDDATPHEKALLMASIILLDFVLFERKQNNNNRR
eukprot:CAMPEP_0196781192 /NCGR_PEP_ID=MMETSP1104-20130614/9219_1 /TAXON_ID=33652 /ORGANISM="Cafeteria sp., Strain Caron Lab Isolate" /LENGTH=313 /DNA_ID=CAMNT_0042151413 /DNA_START=32 /DNA_END=973 /DNA_ORIENTATION=+